MYLHVLVIVSILLNFVMNWYMSINNRLASCFILIVMNLIYCYANVIFVFHRGQEELVWYFVLNIWSISMGAKGLIHEFKEKA